MFNVQVHKTSPRVDTEKSSGRNVKSDLRPIQRLILSLDRVHSERARGSGHRFPLSPRPLSSRWRGRIVTGFSVPRGYRTGISLDPCPGVGDMECARTGRRTERSDSWRPADNGRISCSEKLGRASDLSSSARPVASLFSEPLDTYSPRPPQGSDHGTPVSGAVASHRGCGFES